MAEYTKYELKDTNRDTWKNLADSENRYLSAERLVQAFKVVVDRAVKEMNERRASRFHIKTVTNHPAVTLELYERQADSKPKYSVDLAPVIKVLQWPRHLTNGWQGSATRTGWPPSTMIDTLINTTSVYLVPKLYHQRDHPERNYLWRYAFNEGEKKLLRSSDPGQANNCRRDVLRILKGFLVDLKWDRHNLRSYHMKTVLLHESQTFSSEREWENANLKDRVISAVRRLLSFIRGKSLQHFFLRDINLVAKSSEQNLQQLERLIKAFLDKPEADLVRLTV